MGSIIISLAILAMLFATIGDHKGPSELEREREEMLKSLKSTSPSRRSDEPGRPVI